MTNFMKPVYDDIAERFGLGSSTFGKTMDEHNKGRSEAEALEQVRGLAMGLRADHAQRLDRERRARIDAGEPAEYWINVWFDLRSGEIETQSYTEISDVYEQILDGLTACMYLRTVHVSKSIKRFASPGCSAFNLEDDARRWQVERMGS